MARIDPMFMNSVCLLTDTDSKPLGTSFLYGYPSDDGDEPGFAGWLVTCRHVVYDEETQIIGETLVSLNRHDAHRSQPLSVRPGTL